MSNPYPVFSIFDMYHYKCPDVWIVYWFDNGEVIVTGSYYDCLEWSFGQVPAKFLIKHKTHGDLAYMHKCKPGEDYYSFEPIHPEFKPFPSHLLKRDSSEAWKVWHFPEGLKEEDITFELLWKEDPMSKFLGKRELVVPTEKADWQSW